nr:branched-chain amino acid ABC transporter permease [Alicycliphilus sp.]
MAATHYRFKPWNVGRFIVWTLFALLLIAAPQLFASSLALTMLSQMGYL